MSICRRGVGVGVKVSGLGECFRQGVGVCRCVGWVGVNRLGRVNGLGECFPTRSRGL